MPIKYSCINCKSIFATSSFEKHHNRCKEKGGAFKDIERCNRVSCLFCDKTFKSKSGCGTHEIQCKQNPNRIYRKTNYSWNKGLTKETDSRIKQLSESLKGKPLGGCFAWSSEKRSIEAKRRGFGGYNENAGRSKKFRVLDSFGKDVVLQSSYELDCSVLLNEMNIKWIRPKALKYDTKRNYFADFYLVDYNVWLDPKNDFKAKQDEEKIQKVKEQNGIKLFVLTKSQITVEYIQSLLS
jgi:hypothetical protein